MKKQPENDLELKSESMNEMLSSPPSWIIRSGSGMILIAILLVVTLAWFIKYPDEVRGDIVITSSKAPIELTNQSYVQLRTLNVKENDFVKTGDLIAQFDINVKPEDIQKAIDYLNNIEKGSSFPGRISVFEDKIYLGSFQEKWTDLQSKINEWNSEHSENIVKQELASIQREIKLREQLQIISNKKINLSENEYALIQEQLESSERLAAQNAISKQLLSQEKRTKTQAEQSVQSQKELLVQNLITLNSLRKECLRLEHEDRLKKLQKSAEIQIGISALKNNFENWERNSVWVSPCSGKVLFNRSLQVNRFYKTEEASIIIVPKGNGYSAIATIKTEGAGKVQVGQKTFIDLIDFPKSEFGELEGIVTNITQIDKAGKYELKINLINQLKTTYNKSIPPKAQLKGTVKIITNNKRLLSRFFEQMTDLIK